MEDNRKICKKINELLSPYIDGEISAEEKAMVEEHLKDCEFCQAELENLNLLSFSLKSSMELDDSEIPDFSGLVMSEVEKEGISCEEVSEDISTYFDGELEPAVYYSIEKHLETCTECNEKYKKLEYLRGLIKLSVDSLDIDMWERVYARLKDSEPLKCSFVSDQLSAYLDKEVDISLSKNIAEHILSCEDCRNQFENLKLIQNKVKVALLKPAKDVNFWPAVYSRLAKSNRDKMFAYSSVASIFTAVLVWTVLSVSFPAGVNYSPDIASNNKDNRFWKDDLASVLASDKNNTSDDYLFSNVFDESAGGVIPIAYGEGDYGY